jgi:hypothetical protein
MKFDLDNNLPPPIAYTPPDAARIIGRSRTRIFAAIRDGELVARKDGGRTLIEHDELCRWVRSLPTIGRESAAA